MYTRQSAINKEKIKVPENYGGSMFRSTPSFYETFATPAKTNETYDKIISNTNINDNKERTESENIKSNDSSFDEQDNDSLSVSKEYRTEDLSNNETFMSDKSDDEQNFSSSEYEVTNTVNDNHKKNSLFSGILVPGMFEKHFPFGHGIGSEELLIMGIMLMVYMSYENTKESDGDLMLMLAMLLFAG